MSRSGCSFNQMTQGLILFERGYCRCRGSVGRGYRSAQGDEIGARLSLQRSCAEGSLCGQCIDQFRAQSERRASSRKGFAEQVVYVVEVMKSEVHTTEFGTDCLPPA
ncbi:hypothetical protein PS943_01328 [Pseudomonas fluorescens]|uniref:Uncharacterized protein n=1 Tax=Pseudomonas fluorescens TaxID=294 RepID=A0A5E7W322_PSEFL|nr:hypothetical protein PS943_01328 [Pseudomonas fluorescens]